MNLGFSQKQAQSILNYKQKAGSFKKLEDLQKLYVMSPQKFEQLKAYIVIAKKELRSDYSNLRNNVSLSQPYSNQQILLDINAADSLD